MISPNNTAVAMPRAKKGPKGIAVFIEPFLEASIGIDAINAYNALMNSEKSISFAPAKRPAAAISLISPPPIESFISIPRANKSPEAAKKPSI